MPVFQTSHWRWRLARQCGLGWISKPCSHLRCPEQLCWCSKAGDSIDFSDNIWMSSYWDKMERTDAELEPHTAAGSPVCGHPPSCLKQENTALHLWEWGKNVNKCLCLGTQQQTGTSELPEKHPAGEKEHMGFPEQLVLRSNGVWVPIWVQLHLRSASRMVIWTDSLTTCC